MTLEFRDVQKILRDYGFIQVIGNTGSHLKYILGCAMVEIDQKFPHRQSNQDQRQQRANLIEKFSIIVIKPHQKSYKKGTAKRLLTTIAIAIDKSYEALLQEYQITI